MESPCIISTPDIGTKQAEHHQFGPDTVRKSLFCLHNVNVYLTLLVEDISKQNRGNCANGNTSIEITTKHHYYILLKK